MMGDLSGLTLSTRQRGGTDSFSSKTPFKSRDAPMVSGFDLIGHNRTFQIHWVKRVVAFSLDLAVVFAPLWSFLYLEGIRQPWIYGVLGDRKSTRLNSSHITISYAVFCLKKK